ncbi:MAG: gamma-glutamyltransferase [Caldilineae bacterium]|nr:MAG: gamma-glutamyltransferase [Caldilineae bacterium]
MPLAISKYHHPSRRSTVMAGHGMVATSQPLAAQAGLQVLIEGGNAFDAAVTTAAVLNVVEPMSTGIGGDCFALLYLAGTREVKALNGSGRAPQALTLEVFQARGLDTVPLTGMLPVTVPGTVDGWATLLEAHGTISLADALAPAIRYAEEGFPVTELIARAWDHLAPKLRATPEARAHYLVDGERAPRAGEIFRLPALAQTLRRIAEGGRDSFYQGDIAQAIVEFSQRNDGFLALEDFAAHTSTWVEPIAIDYRGYRVYECPPNGQGLAALLALNIAQGFELPAMAPDATKRLHVLIEAMRLGFADAFTYVADPEHADIPLDALLSEAYAAERRRLIQPGRALEVVPAGQPAGEDTVYLTVVDGDGNACSFINSLYYGFGSGMVAGDTGICLQNRGACFVLDPEHRNCWAPGKRPYHTIIPSLITRDGALFASYGVMGGFMQPQGHLQVVSHLIDHGMSPQQALDAPRFRVLESLDQVAFEQGTPLRALSELAQMGHRVVPPTELSAGFGGGQIILVDQQAGALFGGSDPRKDGCAVGF